MLKIFFAALCFHLAVSTPSFAVDKPGGLTHTAMNLPSDSYELLLSPAYTIAPGGAYLSSELRFQPNEDLGLGFGFGAGEVGFNFGVNGIWYVSPDLETQPAFAILGGLYFNRLEPSNYFIVKVTPMVSKTFKAGWGFITPYSGLHFAPSFRLGNAANEFTIKNSSGVEFSANNMNGVKLWAEFGLGLVNSAHEMVFGLSYPFTGLGG